jgi:hypothetical protein
MSTRDLTGGLPFASSIGGAKGAKAIEGAIDEAGGAIGEAGRAIGEAGQAGRATGGISPFFTLQIFNLFVFIELARRSYLAVINHDGFMVSEPCQPQARCLEVTWWTLRHRISLNTLLCSVT